jgi:hypothetical protein
VVDQEILEQLRAVPQAVFARQCLKVVDENAELVLLEPRPAQLKVEAAAEHQESQGLPIRIIVVKSRKTGVSTWVQGKFVKRSISMPYRRALTVAQDNKTASTLFGIGRRMYDHLPGPIKPDLVQFAQPANGTKIMHFGIEGQGVGSGLDSRVMIDTAKEVSAGRGETFTDLHLSEAAWWDSFGLKGGQIGETKALGLLNAVPRKPGTMVVIESTANGFNWFHKRWENAERRLGGYEPVFIGWTEDPECYRPFLGDTDRTPEEEEEEFIASIGTGPWGEDEPRLVEEFGATPQQLHFRRIAIVDQCGGKLEQFQQEYPATAGEAFIGNSRQVFSVVFTSRAVKQAEAIGKLDPSEGGPERGIFRSTATRTRELLDGIVQVPTAVEWVPERELHGRVEWWPNQFWSKGDPLWTLWLPPENSAEQWRQAHERGEVDLETMEAGMARALLGPGQYVLAGDPADDIENNSPVEKDEHAFNALVGIDHRTGEQVAEFQARMDHDLVARHAFLCALYLNEAWLSIEATGGYGNSMLGLLNKQFYYRFLFRHTRLTTVKGETTTKLGWYTEKQSKQQMEATAQAMLREGTHGIKSPRLAGQLMTYVKDERGRHGPSSGSFSDLLMAWMQAQEVRRLKPLRARPSGDEPLSSIVRRFGE